MQKKDIVQIFSYRRREVDIIHVRHPPPPPYNETPCFKIKITRI